MRQSYGINPNVYNGGAVVFNPLPFVNFMAQQEAKRQARLQAVDQQIADQTKGLTPTGMRSQDLPGWSQKFQELKTIAIRDKDKLRNPASDNFQTFNKFNKLRTELQMEPEISKQAGQFIDAVGKARLEGKANPTDEDAKIIENMGKSIYDKDWKAYTLADLSINRPPFDSAKFLSDAQAGRKRGKVEDTSNAIYDPKRGLMTVNSWEEYKPDEIKAMADNAPFLMGKDRSAKDAFERMLENPQKLTELQQAYNKIYTGIVDTPEKAAQAYTILGIGAKTGFGTDTKPYSDKEEEFKRQKQLIDYRGQWQERLQKAKSAADTKEQGDQLNAMVNDLIKNAKENPHTVTSATRTKNSKGETINTVVHKQETQYEMPPVPDVIKALTIPGQPPPDAARYIKQNGVGYVQPIVYKKRYDESGKYVIGYETRDGQNVVDETYSGGKIPLKQFRDQLGRTIYSGKIEYAETGKDAMFEEDMNFNPGGQSSTNKAVTGTPSTKNAVGDWRTRAKKVN